MIDDHHKEVFYIDNLLALIVHSQSYKKFSYVIHFFQDELIKHFEEEELMMQRIGYADLTHHKEQHCILQAQAQSIIQAYHDKFPLSYLIMKSRFLIDALIDHIMDVDAKLVSQ